ncbi:YeeE/YedE family protein [Meiothermus sp. QL-1]|uniref:YeeE/YedE family protein n=1 Tax=Meiothermus sp. QL-1 TaxID=2058095 RepID=UPI000E0A77A6|nr:YeeE/YedE thiosulfate transporter family protein [Meiothermus sp. QL-1]RDI95338.1 YeeE/YedE family protein [Meiothermus sp. QL-1]
MDGLSQPWPWYVAGPLIGLFVPLLLILGRRRFGISSSLRHLCAALGSRAPFFRYDWRAERWNLAFVLGIFLGGFGAGVLLPNSAPLELNPSVVASLQRLGLFPDGGLWPRELFALEALKNPKVFLFLLLGGMLIGFGARWAAGCTSGHSITGLSALQWPSLLATLGFFGGGLLSAHLLLPWFLSGLR